MPEELRFVRNTLTIIFSLCITQALATFMKLLNAPSICWNTTSKILLLLVLLLTIVRYTYSNWMLLSRSDYRRFYISAKVGMKAVILFLGILIVIPFFGLAYYQDKLEIFVNYLIILSLYSGISEFLGKISCKGGSKLERIMNIWWRISAIMFITVIIVRILYKYSLIDYNCTSFVLFLVTAGLVSYDLSRNSQLYFT